MTLVLVQILRRLLTALAVLACVLGAAPALAATAVTSISPTSGPTSGGTTVVLSGTGLSAVTSLQFGSSDATSFTIDSDTQITAITPSGSAGGAGVGGTYGPSAVRFKGERDSRFTYVARPVVTSISPDTGPASGGTSVVIAGSKLTGATGVTFGSSDATSFTVDSDTQITAVSPSGSAGQVSVKVTTVGGDSNTGVFSRFYYVGKPVLDSMVPASGPKAGGTSVVITGRNLSGVTAVAFGSSAASSFVVDSDTQITAVTPGGSAGQVGVVMTSPGGESDTGGTANNFVYVGPPVLTSMVPASGPVAGGTSVVITGSSLSGVTAVSFGSHAAASFTVDSDTQITAVSPSVPAGQSGVVLTSIGGDSDTGGLANNFLFVAAPVLTSMTPDNGSKDGGTSVVIAGSNLSGVTAVTFGSSAATSFVVDSDTQITAVSPGGSAGQVGVVMTSPGGESDTGGTANNFLYVARPDVSAASATGTVVGGSFSQTNSVTRGVAPFAFSIGSGAVPDGTELDTATGTVSGTPTTAGPFSYVILATDSGGDIQISKDETVEGTIEAAATSVALSTSGSPSDHGEAVTFTATVTSTAGTPTGTVTFSIDGTDQAPATLAVGTATLTTSLLEAGAHTVIATYDGDGNFAPQASDELDQQVEPAMGTITLRVVTDGGDLTLSFASATPELDLAVTTTGGTGTSAPVPLGPGTYAVTALGALTAGFAVTDVTCDDGDSIGNSANGSASIVLAAAEALTCTFTSLDARTTTTTLIEDFFTRRAGLLLANQPDQQRRIDRLNGVVQSGGFGNPGAALMGYLPALAEGAVSLPMMSTSLAAIGAMSGNAAGDRLDAWLQGTFGLFEGNGGAGSFAILSAGVDYLVTPDLLAGAFVEADIFPAAAGPGGGTAGGTGWLAGPYLTARLGENLYLDLLAGAGTSVNEISPYGTYTDTVSAARWTASAALSGQWSAGDFTLAPRARLSYFGEASEGYVDGLGVAIPSIATGIGQVAVGPSISYRFDTGAGVVVDTGVTLDGMLDLAGDALAPRIENLRGRVAGRIDAAFEGGGSASVSATYDGIGAAGGTSTTLSVGVSAALR